MSEIYDNDEDFRRKYVQGLIANMENVDTNHTLGYFSRSGKIGKGLCIVAAALRSVNDIDGAYEERDYDQITGLEQFISGCASIKGNELPDTITMLKEYGTRVEQLLIWHSVKQLCEQPRVTQ